jgi:hypothetical protein
MAAWVPTYMHSRRGKMLAEGDAGARFLWPHGQAFERNRGDGTVVVAQAPHSVLIEFA